MNPAFYLPAIVVSLIFPFSAHGEALPSFLSVRKATESVRPQLSPKTKTSQKQEKRPSRLPADALTEKLPGMADYLETREKGTSEIVPAPRKTEKERYPWRNGIVTTTFWVGEEATKRNPVPNHASSWDQQWAKNYGGFDDPNPTNRADYIPVKFTPQQNPFYCALPYNDTTRGTTKPEASRVIPWFKEAFERPGKSVLKGRWVAIRYNGRVAYAQWEDCGPFRTDHWQYVFGNERPRPNLNKGAGLDVSPAVRDYLGMKSTDVTDWRFVDFEEVPHGPWARHGENNTFVLNARKETQRTALAEETESPDRAKK